MRIRLFWWFLVLPFSAPAQTVADSLIRDGSHQEALAWIDRQTDKDRTDLLEARTNAYIGLGRFEEAEQVIGRLLERAPGTSPSRSAALTLRGFLRMNTGRNDKALEDLTEALNGYDEAAERDASKSARCHAHLGTLYFNTGKYRQAEDHFLRSLDIRSKLHGERHPEIAAALNDLGLVYGQTDPDKALGYYERALELYTEAYGQDHPKIAIASTNLGILFKKLDLLGDAVNTFTSALDIWKRVYPQGHPNQALVLSYLAQTYSQMGDARSASGYFRKSLEQYRRAYGTKHPDIAAVCNQLAMFHAQAGRYDSALFRLQEAFAANSEVFRNEGPASNPAAEDHFHPYVMLYTLQLKAEVLEMRYYGKSLRLEDLRQAVRTLAVCDTLISAIRRQSPEETDKITLGNIAHEVYEDGVRICHAVGELSLNPRPWEEQAFRYAEKSKAGVLLEAIADANARSFAGLPDSLLNQERNLKAALEVASRRLSESAGRNEEVNRRTEVFRIKQEQLRLSEHLRTRYPRYFNLKYQESLPTVRDLQGLLREGDAVVSYFVADKNSSLYIFTLTRERFTVDVRALSDDFNRLINGFYNSVKLGHEPTYGKAAPQLDRILKPRLPKGVGHLIIIPSGPLAKIPFEALPEGKDGKQKGMPDRYWINRWSIGYEFSTALMSARTETRGQGADSILLCAPIDFSERRQLSSLPGTLTEVKSIAALFPEHHEMLLAGEATEDALRSQDLDRFRYLHLATHGVAEEEYPERSRIYLSETERNDGDLFAGEIYNMSLQADLVTLSACQTGLGKVHRGEGIVGLSRALRYAGAQRVVVSYWSVSDEATALLMMHFYRGFRLEKGRRQGYDYAAALAEAKRTMIRSRMFSNPFYWAAFVILGF